MSQFKLYNPNPNRNRVGDCTVRAICKATGKCWDAVYMALCAFGFFCQGYAVGQFRVGKIPPGAGLPAISDR